ncbi:MAG: hypothetical protein MZV63_13795 [Marinilabiliales bacterium]|nr:hypothetical protein [Marinilabiliales bacterium]
MPQAIIAAFFQLSAPRRYTFSFSAIGYKSTILTVPADLAGINYITDVIMVTDTILIGEVLVLPWKTYSEFKRAVLENKPVDPLDGKHGE